MDDHQIQSQAFRTQREVFTIPKEYVSANHYSLPAILLMFLLVIVTNM